MPISWESLSAGSNLSYTQERENVSELFHRDTPAGHPCLEVLWVPGGEDGRPEAPPPGEDGQGQQVQALPSYGEVQERDLW